MMARYRRTFALILFWLTILVTVITAFRLRDLPKTSKDKVQTGTKKCENCEVYESKFSPKLSSNKFESAKRSYEELKRVVRQQQKLDNINKDSPKLYKNRENNKDGDNDDKDDDGEIDDTKNKPSIPLKSDVNVKSTKLINKAVFDVDDDDDDDDDDSDDENNDDDNDDNNKYKRNINKISNTNKESTMPVNINKVLSINNQESHGETRNLNKNKPLLNRNVGSFEYSKNSHIVKLKNYSNKRLNGNNNRDNDDEDNDDDDDDDDDNDNDDDDNDDDADNNDRSSNDAIKIYKDNKKVDEKSYRDNVESETFTSYTTTFQVKHPVKKLKISEDSRRIELQLKTESEIQNNLNDTVKVISPKVESPSKDSMNKTYFAIKGEKDKYVDGRKENNTQYHSDKNKMSSISSSKSQSINKSNEGPQNIKLPKLDNTNVTANKNSSNSIFLKIEGHKNFSGKPAPKSYITPETSKTLSKTSHVSKLENKSTLPKFNATKKDEKLQESDKSVEFQDKNEDAKLKMRVTPKKDAPVENSIKIKRTVDYKPVSDNKLKSSSKKEISAKESVSVNVAKAVNNTKIKMKDTKNFKSPSKTDPVLSGDEVDAEEEKLNNDNIIEDSYENMSRRKFRDLSDAVQRKSMLRSEFEDLYSFLPTFAPNFSLIHNTECRHQGQIILRQLRGTKLWAFNMLDATAKIPSGLLRGNGIQLGDFDQCLGSHARVKLDTGTVEKLSGKYCLARLDLKAEQPELELPVHLAQAKSLIKSRVDDPGHFIPRFSTLSWGVCVPSTCDPDDVELLLKDALKHYQHTTGLVIRFKVDQHDCYTEENADPWEKWLDIPTAATLSLYAIVVLLVVVATIQDVCSSGSDESNTTELNENAECDQKNTAEKQEDKEGNKTPGGFVTSFSLIRTFEKLTAPGSEDEISCVHGVRAIATLALLVAHKFITVAVMPYTNRLKIVEIANLPVWSWCRAGWIFTDCFLILSGTLTAYHGIKQDSTGPKRLLSRYFRLTPALLAVLLFYAYIWDKLSTGPMWGSLVTKNAEICKESWWWNLLYVQNYYPFEEMCAPQSHQLALDMQLTLLGSIIVWLVQVKPRSKYLIFTGLHITVAYMRYITFYEHRLTLLAYHGVSVSQLYRTARLSYTSTLHRSTPYLIGLSLGLSLQKPKRHKFLLIIGWLVSAVLWGAVFWAGLDAGSLNYRYNVSYAAQYAALAPIGSAMAIAWLIYATHNGRCWFTSNFLCCRPLVIVSRLSYALFLCQFLVFFTNAATVRSSSEFTLMSLIDLHEIILLLASSVLLTLTFILPMQSLHKLSLFDMKSGLKEKTDENLPNVSKVQYDFDFQKNVLKQSTEWKESFQPKNKINLMAHREILEEIPEVEIEYEVQRDKEGLEEIIEEEEGEEDLSEHMIGEELDIVEEEYGGEEDYWVERSEYTTRRSYSAEEEQDLDEWEWTVNGNNYGGAQNYHYMK